MPYTESNLIHHGSVRFATLPIDQWHLFLLPWNGGGITLLDPLTNQWRMHKIPFETNVGSPYVIDVRDCNIEGVPHQALVDDGRVYNVYAHDDGAGNISIDFSLQRENVIEGYIVKGPASANYMLVGRVGVLPQGGGIGFGGGPTCAMCASYFQPERMCIFSEVGGASETPGAWVEIVPFEKQLHFVCFGDGREPNVRFDGMVANSIGTYNTYVGLSSRGADPEWKNIGGGTSPVGGAIVQASCILPGAGWGDGVELYQRFGLKLRVEGGRGSLFNGKIWADVWM